MEYCSNCVIKNSDVTDNTFYGIHLFQGSANTIKNNIIARSTFNGIFLWSDGNIVQNNGIYDSNTGIDVLGVKNNIITSNYIIGNGKGVSTTDNKNTYIDNLFINHNYNFENWSQPGINDFNLTTPATGTTNIIEGSRIGGNYWAFPKNNSGYSQICPDTNTNGICDTSYTLYPGNRDAFPLAPGKNVTGLTFNVPSVAFCQVPYTVTGQLTGSGRVANLPVFIEFPYQNGFWTVTDNQGNYQFSLRSGMGVMQFNTTFPGWSTSRPSNSPSKTLSVLSQGKPIVITLSAPPSITTDQEYTVSGYATSNGAGISVNLVPEYSWDNATWDAIFKWPSSIKTNSAGYYSWNESNISSSTNHRYLRVRHDEDCYYVSGMSPTKTITITGVVHLPGYTNTPTDPDGDGIYEDLNANGRLDFADVVLYFNQMTWIAANEPIAAFDLNGNGRIDFADIVALFNEI
jgi:parallel beta-helix repeat protein